MDLARALQKMRGPAGKRVMLTIMREGFSAPREIAIIRDHIRIVSVEGALYGGIGYVKVKNFQERTDALPAQGAGPAARRSTAASELRGLVLDLRNNPGGLLDQAVAVSDRFLPGQPHHRLHPRPRRGATPPRRRARTGTRRSPTRWWCW